MTEYITFNVADFKSKYPNINLSNDRLEFAFEQATMLLNNEKNGGVQMPDKKRKMLFYLLVAHLATLQSKIDGGNDAVGKVTSASEGSVSVSLDAGQTTFNKTFYQQTQYGAMYLALTAKYRSFLYTMGFMPMKVRRGRADR